jgi:hypothetical protein
MQNTVLGRKLPKPSGNLGPVPVDAQGQVNCFIFDRSLVTDLTAPQVDIEDLSAARVRTYSYEIYLVKIGFFARLIC